MTDLAANHLSRSFDTARRTELQDRNGLRNSQVHSAGRVMAPPQNTRAQARQAMKREDDMATNQMTAMKTSDQRRDKIDYCMIYAAMFTIFLGAALIQRCLPQRWRSHPCDRLGRKSLFDEVRCATRDMMPFAFMG